jgi:hypothetical protein
MDLNSIHSFLIHPGKNLKDPHSINGTAVTQATARLFDMLKRIFDTADSECQHEIAFTPDKDDEQRNECRDSLLAYIKNCDIPNGRLIATKLQAVTTNKSGLGLLFLMTGQQKAETKIVISRFPADSGILAEERAKGLTVEFLERIFMKSATSYKAAVYSGRSLDKDFWKGKAVDKQINSADSIISDYWIRDFLRSDFLTPGEAGTRRFAIAVRDAMNRSEDGKVKEDIVALQHLVAGMPRKVLSAKDIVQQFHVSEETHKEIKERFPREALFEERFRFVPSEFVKHVAIKTIELDNGGLLAAPTERFDDVFRRETVDATNAVVRFSTQGKIVDQRFRKVAP